MLLLCLATLLLWNATPADSWSRIIGGSSTNIQKHPHQVSLKRLGSHICGASIIDQNWVITAAHCVQFSASQLSIGLNGGNLNQNEDLYSVASIIVHPDYNKNNIAGAYPNDVALLKLTRNMDFTKHGHKAIELATSVNDGTTCTISGWGNTVTGSGTSMPTTLQETTGRIDGTTCAQAWGSNYNSNVHICIHNSNTGACNGDSGGPMVCNGALAGVTSWGASGCITSHPSVYARVSTFRSWILTTMAAN